MTNQTWRSRLKIFRRLFPWVNLTIKEWAGLPPDKPTDDYTHEENLAFLAASKEYERGYRSDRPEVRALHDRQNAEWTSLTGLPPLGSMEDWRAASTWAGIPPTEFEKFDFARMESCIAAWALAKRANLPPVADPETEAPPAPPDKGSNPTPTRKARRKPGQLNGEMLAMVQSNPESQGWTSLKWAKELRSNPSQIVKQPVWKAFEQLRLEQRAERQVGKRRGRSNQNVFDRDGEAEKWSE